MSVRSTGRGTVPTAGLDTEWLTILVVSNPTPRTCFKYMKYGADQQRGCTQGLECNWFHPVICQTSLQKLRCKKEVCSLIHLYTARKAKKDNTGRFPSEHKSSQRSNGPSVGNSTRDRVKKDTKLTLMKEKDFLQALLIQQEQFLREMKDLVIQTRYQSPLTHPNEWPAVQIPVLNHIETPSYLAGRPAFSQYLEDNPWSARRKGINIFRSQQ